jgi:hypothetical protein
MRNVDTDIGVAGWATIVNPRDIGACEAVGVRARDFVKRISLVREERGRRTFRATRPFPDGSLRYWLGLLLLIG